MNALSGQNKKCHSPTHIYMNKKPEYILVKTDSEKDVPSVLAWKIQVNEKTVGAIGIDLEDTQHVESPSVRLAIDEADRGISAVVMKEIIKYAYCNLPSEFLYARQLVSDAAADKLNKSLGFEKDGDTYTDDDSLTWQNLKLAL
jgi:predicted GNAT family N-acyltransferase